jgi:glycosyltransferase involved in cell wall biosynthesis
MKRPAVTVVIPTRDRPDLLAWSLRSVLSQKGVDIDVVVVDDGDGPKTAALVAAVDDPRVRFLRNSGSRGVSGARNCGVASATKGWVAFCDDDDLWAPDKLSAQISAAEAEGAAWVYAGDVTVDEHLRLVSGAPPPAPEEVVRDLVRYNAVPAGASNVVVRSDALARVGPFDPELRTSEDWDVWLRLARVVGRPACVPRPLVAIRIHSQSFSRRTESVLGDLEVIARRHGVPVDRIRHYRWVAWMALQDGQRWTAVQHYGKAVLAGDWRSAGRAVVAILHPQITRRPPVSVDDPWFREAREWLGALCEPDQMRRGCEGREDVPSLGGLQKDCSGAGL